MAKIDEIKEEIGAMKTYLGFLVAFIISTVAGISKLYLDKEYGYLLIVGVVSVVIFSIIFAFIAKNMHKKIKSLRNYK